MPCLVFDNHIPLCSIAGLQYFKGLTIRFYHTSQNIFWPGKTYTFSGGKMQYSLLLQAAYTFDTEGQDHVQ